MVEYGGSDSGDTKNYTYLSTDASQTRQLSSTSDCILYLGKTIIFKGDFFWSPELNIISSKIYKNKNGNEWKICSTNEHFDNKDYKIIFKYDSLENIVFANVVEYLSGTCNNNFFGKNKINSQEWHFEYLENTNRLVGWRYFFNNHSKQTTYKSEIKINYNKHGLPKAFFQYSSMGDLGWKLSSIRKYKYCFGK